ncbi:MAG: helix-hairpin-helix domain-containing protein [Arenicella sp.]|nr:helix-hairpin-helix domain-containing protein [Arenicella sp.]
MNPSKVLRDKMKTLTDLPNIGKAGEEDLTVLGINKAEDLIGLCPYEMHASLCEKTGVRHDPCVIDVFISITKFMDGGEPKPWWKYTDERKAHLIKTRE